MQSMENRPEPDMLVQLRPLIVKLFPNAVGMAVLLDEGPGADEGDRIIALVGASQFEDADFYTVLGKLSTDHVNAESSDIWDITKHDEATMSKVHEALMEAGFSTPDITDAINAMQNKGILFRELL